MNPTEQIRALADSVDGRGQALGSGSARELVDDWLDNGEPELALEHLADAIVEDDVLISPEDFDLFEAIALELGNSERVISAYLQSLVD
ncbi:MafI family immunity protein [Deinococcus sp. Arct2-2]|uniref:MafI family immunity protein n=1 Tax=Deinococcus sp. Arct2-2 TaxID=2568653 RepID=UPI0010A343AC|nr:MafI family immunity protein [Deinococcus sp. Arct2-2]THF67609.1 MafI family immunity protein [Deinococcus sp. Arct2-2]